MADPPPEPAEDPCDPVERLCEAYLERVADGENPDFETAVAQLPTGDQCSRFRVDASVGEWLWRSDVGQPVKRATFLERLESEDERARFLDAVDAAHDATRRLPWRLDPGARVEGRYEILERLDEGGIGTVYIAHDERLDRPVALKAVRVDPRLDARELARNLGEESKTLAGLSSPHIVKLFDALGDGDRVCLVLDLIGGFDLHHVVTLLAEERARVGSLGARRKLEIVRTTLGSDSTDVPKGVLAERDWYRAVARLLCRLTAALERAHASGVLHRDLKPKNVMLAPDGEPVLLDFGLAHRVGAPIDEKRPFQGTPEYLAPEQVRSKRTGADPRTDVYALGLILYELLALERAFHRSDGEPITALFGRIERRVFRPLSEHDPRIPAALRAITDHALATEPDDRYPSMVEFLEDLERWLRGQRPRHARLERRAAVGMWMSAMSRRPVVAALVVGLGLAGAWGAREWLRPRLGQAVRGYFALHNEPSALRVPIQEYDTIQPDTLLVAEFGGNSSACVYPFSLMASDLDGTRYVVPTWGTPDQADWGRDLVPGVNYVDAAVVELEGYSRYEGILMILTPRPDEDLEQRLVEQWGPPGASDPDAMTYSKFKEVMIPPHERGGSPAHHLDLRERYRKVFDGGRGSEGERLIHVFFEVK